MNIGWKSVAWSAAALVLLLSIPTNLIVVTMFLLMVPIVVLYTILKPIPFLLHLVGVGLVTVLLLGTYAVIPLSLGFFFLIPSAVMGHMYKKHRPARTVVTTIILILIAQLIIELAIFSTQYDMDLAGQMSSLLEETLAQVQSGALLPSDWAATTADSLGDAIVTALPSLLLLSSFLFAIITHYLSRLSLRSMGIVVPAMSPMKNWMLPRSLVFYYFVALILSYALSPDYEGFWNTVAANAVPILQFAFRIQAIAFFFYLADMKKWPRIAPIAIAIPVFLISPLYLIGLIDVAFPLRRYFSK
ncbi:DUF2232 domain-containing protein [Cohnella lubricantis]|uniref:DUF2232 domain-containing protein n=1 Tax=Cohnella lubricantis TaxID=2163172 RepID=A0A841TG53_9BACL|nr:DUF2232 domain-containing protein [Cohnella lubricantis]MBB6678210.1 DUF2232 domain-containing protein [Cohnella lubricantis]MBP2120065.1 uncharacterized protein YybS (DUF2232 family) [Cohnella lubricantis]